MGGEPWLIRKKHEADAEKTLAKYRDEILKLTPDWPEIRIGEADQSYDSAFCCLIPFSQSQLVDLFGTETPQSSVSTNDIWRLIFWEDIERGQGRYFVLHAGDKPEECCFLGYSFD